MKTKFPFKCGKQIHPLTSPMHEIRWLHKIKYDPDYKILYDALTESYEVWRLNPYNDIKVFTKDGIIYIEESK